MSDYRPVVSVEETIDAAPSKVWETATKKTGVMFMGADVETDWKEGHPITFKGKWQGKSFEDKGKVETVEEGRRLAFTHFSPASRSRNRCTGTQPSPARKWFPSSRRTGG